MNQLATKLMIGSAAVLMIVGFTSTAVGGGKAIEIKPDEFAKEWKANAQATQKKYNGKTVTFTGPVHGFSVDTARKSSVNVRCEPGGSSVRLPVRTKEAEPWTVYSIGQVITVTGVFNASLGAVIENATITTKAKNTTITLKSTDLAEEATPDRDKAAKKYLDQGVFVVGEVVKMNDSKNVVFLKGKGEVLIECFMYPVDKPALGSTLTVGKEAKIFGKIQEQLSPILDDSKAMRVSDCFPVLGKKK